MRTEDQKRQLSHVDSSGFPLQLRIAHEVRKLPRDADCEVIATEFPWEDQRTGRQGFIDLLIRVDRICFVVECKRRSGGNWTFLAPTEGRPPTDSVRLCYADRSGVHCADPGFGPATVESEYCVVPGSGGKNDSSERRSLERIASQLVLATESIAAKHRLLPFPDPFPHALPMGFVPMIVSVPSPAVARFSVERVSLEEGTLGDGEVGLEPVVRFRKAFALEDSTPFLEEPRRGSLADIAQDRERTVFVVHAPEIQNFLAKLWYLPHAFLFPSERTATIGS